MCGQRVCAATECRCNNIPYTFHSWNGERGEERRWEGEQREREREKGDRGMTYIWPTGRRVELLIQFALKHSLRFISFPDYFHHFAITFLLPPSRHSSIHPLRFRRVYLSRSLVSTILRLAVVSPSSPAKPSSAKTTRERSMVLNNPEKTERYWRQILDARCRGRN